MLGYTEFEILLGKNPATAVQKLCIFYTEIALRVHRSVYLNFIFHRFEFKTKFIDSSILKTYIFNFKLICSHPLYISNYLCKKPFMFIYTYSYM